MCDKQIKHDPKIHCKICLWPKLGIGCQVFKNRSDPILNENGMCQGRITDKSKFKKLLDELQ